MNGELQIQSRSVIFHSKKFMLGMLVAPLFLSVVWCRPEGIKDFIDLKYLFILGLNVFTAYPDFVFHFAVTYLIVKKTKLLSASNYFFVIFMVSILIFVALNIYYLHGINGLGYAEVVVLENGSVTNAGFIYLIKEGFFNAVGHVGAMYILWSVGFKSKHE